FLQVAEVHARFEERLVQAFIIFHFNFFLMVNKIMTIARLTFRELEAAASFAFTKLLTLYRTWVAGQQALFFQRIVILLSVFQHQSAGNTQLYCFGLAFGAAAGYSHSHIKTF